MAVEAVEVTSREPYADAAAFGEYERIAGVLRFAVDPLHEANRCIVDLDKAQRGPDGLVRFESDFRLLAPSTGGSGRLLVLVPNRGRLGVVPFSRPTRIPPLEPSEQIDPGDGFLLRRGWAVLWCGWQWDVVRRPGLVGLEAPQALAGDGQAIRGTVLVRFQPAEPHADQILSHYPLDPPPSRRTLTHRPYPAARVDDPDAVLYADRDVVARDRWRFARDSGDGPVWNDTHVWLEGGFRPGVVYEVVYRTRICPVAGTGLIAIRDAAAHLRRDGLGGRVDHAYAHGVSQTGRFLRQFLLDGMNADEHGRAVYDGVLPHVAGARRGEFNHRYAQPSAQHAYGFGHLPPFATRDLVARAGAPVKVIETNTSSEYWRSECSLCHTDPETGAGLDEPAGIRQYLFAGTMHIAGFPALISELPNYPGTRTVNPLNVVNYTPLLRAALVALDEWVAAGVPPPPSRVPRTADATAASREEVLKRLSRIEGLATLDPAQLPSVPRLDLGPDAGHGVGRYPPSEGQAYPSLVSAVDDDGNEIAGIRLPDVSVPLATHTGWNPRDPSMGAEGQGVDMLGSSVPFRVTRRTGNPRPGILERYRSRGDYLSRVQEAAAELVRARHLLPEDVEFVVAQAGRLWDVLAGEA